MARRTTVRNVALAVLGAFILVLKPAYHGPCEDLVSSYAGNVAVSFSLYFAAINVTPRLRRPRLTAALSTLVAVEAFELTSGFGVMANIFDPIDLLANAAGIALALLVDLASSPLFPSMRDACETSSAFVEPAHPTDLPPQR